MFYIRCLLLYATAQLLLYRMYVVALWPFNLYLLIRTFLNGKHTILTKAEWWREFSWNFNQVFKETFSTFLNLCPMFVFVWNLSRLAEYIYIKIGCYSYLGPGIIFCLGLLDFLYSSSYYYYYYIRSCLIALSVNSYCAASIVRLLLYKRFTCRYMCSGGYNSSCTYT